MARPEVLAPAGDRECVEAAIRAGADAVYFGLRGFNARARAHNFDETDVKETLALLHDSGVKGYVTLNTLVFDSELPELERAVDSCAEAGADAVIVQDLGVARVVRERAPELPLHASTQMTCTDAASVAFARSVGARRVVLARELSLDDIRAIRAATDVELEVFVHGALCVAYSGQCLTSEAIGGRSANRGACAQACRLPYELIVDGVLRDLGDRAYLLSPQDLAAVPLVGELAELGVSSLKIEGRLKTPAYVAAVTRLYREAVFAAVGSGPAPSVEHRELALQTYSRGSGPGFLQGVDHQQLVEGRSCDHRGLQVGSVRGSIDQRGRRWLVVQPSRELRRGDGVLVEGGLAGADEIGGRVWALEQQGRDVELARPGRETRVWLGPERALHELPWPRRLFKTSDPRAQDEINRWIGDRRPPELVAITVAGTEGTTLRLFARTEQGLEAHVDSDVALTRAHNQPLTREVLAEKLGKLGETRFALGELTIDLPPNLMLPLSALNRARRALVAALEREPARAPTRPAERVASPDSTRRVKPAPPGLFVLCRNLRQAQAAFDAGADGVYLDFLELTGTGDALRQLRAEQGRTIGVAPPRIRKPGEEKIDRYLRGLEPDMMLVRGLGALHESTTQPPAGALLIGDFSLNVSNGLSAAEVLARGLSAFTPSFDLDGEQLYNLLTPELAAQAEVVVHHPMPLFHMEHCVFAALLSSGKDYKSCGRPCERHDLALRDRAGMQHPVIADVGCRNTVFHAAAQSAADLVQRLRGRGVTRFRVELVREDEAETRRVVTAYQRLLDGLVTAAEVRRELRTVGSYGVVRGSLRVVS